mgnify:FL=1
MEDDLHEPSPSSCSVNWPSKSSVLETPERQRFQNSISFVDSGLGSSLFNSPTDQVPMKSLKTSPLLRTPTDRSVRSVENFCMNATPSPIKSFVHMSSCSSIFSSPEIRKCSVSKHELRLSNPENATSYQFSGNSFTKNCGSPINMTSNDIIMRSKPLSVKQYYFTTPSTSRVSNRALNLPSPSENVDIENEEGIDVTFPYTNPQTPSKGFELDPAERSLFEADDLFEFPTSTPLRDTVCNRGDIAPFQVHYPRIFEQASGPLESSICDSTEVTAPVSDIIVSPSKITLSSAFCSNNYPHPADQSLPEPSYRETFLDHSKLNSSGRERENRECNAYVSPGMTEPFEFNDTDFKPFQPPTKRLEPFSRSWSEIVFGNTRHQRELTRHAHTFLEAQSVHIVL